MILGKTLRVAYAISVLAAVLAGCSDPAVAPAGPPPGDLGEQVREALAEPLHIDRMARLASALEQLRERDLADVRPVFDEHLPGLARGEVRMFVSAWASLDPLAAHAWARAIPFESQREEALAVSVQDWAVRSPLEAQRVAEELVLPGRRRAANPLSRLVKGWVHSPEGGLEDYLVRHPERGDLVSAVVQEIYRARGAQGVMRWTETFVARSDDSDQRWQAFRKAVRTIGYRDPEAATGWVSERYANDAYARDGPTLLAESWAWRDPEQAIEWLRSRAPEPARAEALEATYRTWLNRDGDRAREWLAKQPDDRFYDPAHVATAKLAIRSRDADRAIASCDRVAPSQLRQNCLHAVAAQWYGWDPVAAGAWMEASDLDPELRDSVRSVQQKLRKRRQH
jgi:hypothetical protein